MRLTPDTIHRIIGQTPCLCGDIETWHPHCYRGKTQEQIRSGYKIAYRIARKKLHLRHTAAAASAIAIAQRQPEGDAHGR